MLSNMDNPLKPRVIIQNLASNKFNPVPITSFIRGRPNHVRIEPSQYGDTVRSWLPSSLHKEALLFYNQENEEFDISYLPDLCQKPQCRKPNCGKVHICANFLLDRCALGSECTLSHQFHDEQNRDILTRNKLETVDEDTLKSLFLSRHRPPSLRPKLCTFYSGGKCDKRECTFLHMCRYYFPNNCSYGRDACKRSHQLLDDHNKKILKEYKVNVRQKAEELDDLIRCWVEEQKLPPPRPEIELCKFYGKGECSRQDSCQFLHLCLYYLEGNCQYGPRCIKSHDVLDRHNVPVLRHKGIDTMMSMHGEIEQILVEILGLEIGGAYGGGGDMRRSFEEMNLRDPYQNPGRNQGRDDYQDWYPKGRESREKESPTHRQRRAKSAGRPRRKPRHSISPETAVYQRQRMLSESDTQSYATRNSHPGCAIWQYKVNRRGWCAFPDVLCRGLESALADVSKTKSNVDIDGRRFECDLDEISMHGFQSEGGTMVRRLENEVTWLWYTGHRGQRDSWRKISDVIPGAPDVNLLLEHSFRLHQAGKQSSIELGRGKAKINVNFHNWSAKTRGRVFDLRRRPAMGWF